MINNKKLNEYISRATPVADSVEEPKEINKVEIFNQLQDVIAQLDNIQSDSHFQEDEKENGFPDDLGLAILRIKADAKAGNDRAIETLSKINNALNI